MGYENRHENKWRMWISLSWKDSFIALGILFGAFATCVLFRIIEPEFSRTSMVFLLAVFLVARFTNGCLYGVVSSVIGIGCVNFFFTEPTFEFNFSMSGYPLAIACKLVVAIITSAMMTQIKQQNVVKLGAEKEKVRGNLLRAVSHDIRTPLTSIMGASSALLDTQGAIGVEEQKKLVRGIYEEAQWLLRMVENLLSVTRIDEEYRGDIQKSEEPAEEIVAAAVTKFRKRYPQKEVTVSIPQEYIQISVDPILIEQVLINLLENVEHHARSATEVSVELRREGEWAVFEVVDNGMGIKKEILPYVFSEGFYYGDEDGGDKRRNMGIGLSVCHTIVRVHGGTMTAKNRKEPEHGAIFAFTLPAINTEMTEI